MVRDMTWYIERIGRAVVKLKRKKKEEDCDFVFILFYFVFILFLFLTFLFHYYEILTFVCVHHEKKQNKK